MSPPSGFYFEPIGFARSPFREPAEAPRQPRVAASARGSIELVAGRGYEDALSDVALWEYLWVLFVFDRSKGWRPKVLPPRSAIKRGVFATRAPHRPNPIGMSVVRLEAVEGLVLRVAELDLLDGTPILDLKPYVAWADAIPNAGGGWLDETAPEAGHDVERERPPDPKASYDVEFLPHALERLRFLEESGALLMQRIREVLALGPEPHAYRRIRRLDDGTYRLAIKDWRITFTTEGRRILVTSIATGYRPRELFADRGAPELHRRFVERFGLD